MSQKNVYMTIAGCNAFPILHTRVRVVFTGIIEEEENGAISGTAEEEQEEEEKSSLYTKARHKRLEVLKNKERDNETRLLLKLECARNEIVDLRVYSRERKNFRN